MTDHAAKVFARYEKKYILDQRQYWLLRRRLTEHMREDDYGRYTVGNLYFDTEDYALIRASLEKPLYKEKLRLRSYGTPQKRNKVYAELKKKYDGVVYKRRVGLTVAEAQSYFMAGRRPARKEQIINEIDWFLRRYRPAPKVFIGYERQAWVGRADPALRVTFDHNLRWRNTQLELTAGDEGYPLLKNDRALMEIKIAGAIPLWLSRLLSEQKLYPASFSKYGACFTLFLREEFLQTGV